MSPFECYAMVVLIGTRTKAAADHVNEAVKARSSERVPGKDGKDAGVGFKRGRCVCVDI